MQKVTAKTEPSVTYKNIKYLQILLSVYFWASEADIMHLEQKVVNFMTWKQFLVSFRSL